MGPFQALVEGFGKVLEEVNGKRRNIARWKFEEVRFLPSSQEETQLQAFHGHGFPREPFRTRPDKLKNITSHVIFQAKSWARDRRDELQALLLAPTVHLEQFWEKLERKVVVQVTGRGGNLFASVSSSLTPKPSANIPIEEGNSAFTLAMSRDQVSKRLDGVLVYTICNSSNEFILTTDLSGIKSLAFFCFRKEDAETLLVQVKDRESSLGRGARVVPVSLDKVYQLKAEGISFRFLPDPNQIRNAIELRSKAGVKGRAFDGVPVFQSENLILRSKNRRLCPVFFSKEDCEIALKKALMTQQKVNASMRVGTFEDVLQNMEAKEEDSVWGDLIFIPPGSDVQTSIKKASASRNDTVFG